MQSAAGEPTRDKELLNFVLGTADKRPENFLIVFPVLLTKIRQRVLYVGEKTLNVLLDELSKLLQLYAFSRSGRLQRLVIQVLHSTINLWSTPSISAGEVGEKIRTMCDWLSEALRKKKINSWLTRDAFATFLDEYLEHDPEQFAWSIAEENEDDEQRNERLAGLPTSLLMLMNSDEDTRVRFRNASVVGRLFSAARRTGYDPMLVYGELRGFFTNNLDKYVQPLYHASSFLITSSFEHMLTRTLALGNIMIISSEVRRGAYWHILETCFYDNRYNSHIEAILKGVSERTGLANPSELFRVYASQLAYSICKMKADIHQLTPSLLGYRDRLECADATFRSFAPSMIFASPDMFKNHCMVLKKSVAGGIRECFGDIVGSLILVWIGELDCPIDGLEPYLKERTGMTDEEFMSTFHVNVDRIMVSVLKSLRDQDISPDGPIVNALRNFDSTGTSARTFKALTRFRTAEDFHTHHPNLPAHPTPVVLKALDWIASRSPEAKDKATTYHIMHQVLADIQSSPLINEQYRLVNGLTLWISLRHSDFEDMILLHSLAHGATSLLAQSDLAQAAQSWLEWAFHRYIKERLRDKRLSNILIRIACYAYEHARNSQDASVSRIGSDILKWIDEKIQNFEESDSQSQIHIFRPQILRALPAWSHQPSPQILNLSKRINANMLSSLLNDPQITTNKFRTVRRLRGQAIAGSDESCFETNDFWRLKKCIPPRNDLQIEDADAFADLLHLHRGQISSFGAEQAMEGSVRALHLESQKQSNNADGGSAARDAIIRTLLSRLDGDEASKVHLAYRTMRWIMSIIPAEEFSLNPWSSEIKNELNFLQKCRWTSRPQSQRKLEELGHESFIDSTCNFSQWVSMFTILLADVLSSTDAFYAQLAPILGTNADFAGEVLPVLVCRLLQRDVNKDHANKQILSEYFTRVLAFETSDISCIRAVVDVVLHLRHSTSKTKDALAYNKWLNISYTLLARSALRCGSYTTALLFLELAFEFMNDGAVESSEEILYEIYSHIDEPDGFYGITSQDLGRFLIKRFHHEKQWDKALQFHGAALEAGSREGNEAEGLLEAFHAFGFNQLAIDTLRGPSALGSNVPRTSYMYYQLAWRTETWDLPETSEKTSGAALYHALRSIYRERDAKAVDRVVHSSLLDEVSRLRPLGAENLAEIRKVARDIMCLGEIFRWRHHDIQDQLASKRTDTNIWNNFVTMPEGFK